MENQELKHFISQQLAGGTPAEEIKHLLVKHGWSPDAIEANFPKTQPAPVTGGLINLGGFGEKSKPVSAAQSKNRGLRLGIWFIVSPFVLLVLVLTAYAIAQFSISNMMSSTPVVVPATTGGFGELNVSATSGLGVRDSRAVTASIINVVLGLLGMLAFLGIFIMVPLGIVYIVRSRKEILPDEAYDSRSGKGDASVVPPEIHGWNWGAAFLGFWWGLYYRTWLMLLMFVPVVNIFWWIVMGIKGNEWAWRKNKWVSVEEFKVSQRKWMPWAIVILVIRCLGVVIWMVLWSAIFAGLMATGISGSRSSSLSPGFYLNANAPSGFQSTFTGKVGLSTGQIFNLATEDGRYYSVDMSSAEFTMNDGTLSQKIPNQGDSVVVKGTLLNGIIKASSVIDLTAEAPLFK